MSTTIQDIINHCRCYPSGSNKIIYPNVPKFFQLTLSKNSGVYVIYLDKPLKAPPFCMNSILQWVYNFSVKVNGSLVSTTNLNLLIDRLSDFWLKDEQILYIGKAGGSLIKSTLMKRIMQYYKTPLGAKKPHRGGFWLKTLDNLQYLNILQVECNNPPSIEIDLLDLFSSKSFHHGKKISTNPSQTIETLSKKILPFANLQFKNRDIKPHGISW